MSSVGEAVPARRWYYGWNIVAATIVSQIAADGLTYNAFPLFVQRWSRDLHAPISELQLAVVALVLTCALASPATGVLADRLPARRLFACGLLGIGIFYVAVSMAKAAWELIALFGLLAPLALCLSASVTANPLISRWFVRRRGLALGLSAFGLGIGGVLLPPLIAELLPQVGWRTIWRVGGLAVAVLVTPLVALVMRDRPTKADGLAYLGDASEQRAHQDPLSHASGPGWREILGHRNFWLLLGIYLPMMAVYGGVAQNLPPYAASHGWDRLLAGQLLSVLNLSQVAATLALGVLSDRFGNRLPLVGLAVVVGTGAAALAFGTALPAIVLGCVFVGFGGGIFTLLAAAMAVEYGATGLGRAFGASMFFLPLGSFAPFAIAKTQEMTGSYRPALIGTVLLAAISGGLSLLLRERGRIGRAAAGSER